MAIRTYTATLFHMDDLAEAKVELYLTVNTKYEDRWYDEQKKEFTGLKSWSIIEGGPEAEEIEEQGLTWEDENHEYLILEFVDGTKKYYRNSHAVLFIL